MSDPVVHEPFGAVLVKDGAGMQRTPDAHVERHA
jgi:hypothetical protein